jgi:hypothetical protein
MSPSVNREGVHMSWVGGSKQAWDARQNLLDAAHLIDSACAWAEKDEKVYDRLGEFPWNGVAIPLDELANELRNAAEFIVDHKTVQPWEETEHLCGYSVFMGEQDLCYHQGCYEEAEAIQIALAMKLQANTLLHNFIVEEDPEDRDAEIDAAASNGYDEAIRDLKDWVRIWSTWFADTEGHDSLTREECMRVESVVDNGGKFEDFITREIFFIEEGQ